MNESEPRIPEPTPDLEARRGDLGATWRTIAEENLRLVTEVHAILQERTAERDRLRAEVERLREAFKPTDRWMHTFHGGKRCRVCTADPVGFVEGHRADCVVPSLFDAALRSTEADAEGS